MNWDQIVDKVTPYVVKIDTPDGHGTGFLSLYNEARSFCGIATAAHVVEHADEWQQPIRIRHPKSGSVQLFTEEARVIYLDRETDSAVILLFGSKLELPEVLISLLPADYTLPIGVEVGWLGFPSIDPNTICFFSGNVSAQKKSSYLIDGVAINGVSGGPVIFSHPTEGAQIVGTISAYMPNRTASGVLPGLSVAQDVSHFSSVSKYIKDRDQALREKQRTTQPGTTSETADPDTHASPSPES